MNQKAKNNAGVDGYVRKHKDWSRVLEKLRSVILAHPLKEEVKWRVPCYTFEGRNIIVFGAFKESCMLNFFKGVLLKDPEGILVKPGENSQSSRVMRFTDVSQIDRVKSTLDAYIDEAIEVEKSGAKVKLKEITDYKPPAELKQAFNENPALKAAFMALTPGRQRAYIMYFSAAKQSATREARIRKYTKEILGGKGMND